jgi:hypothetical protein
MFIVTSEDLRDLRCESVNELILGIITSLLPFTTSAGRVIGYGRPLARARPLAAKGNDK